MKIPIFPGKYHQNGGFSMAMLVYRRVEAKFNYTLDIQTPRLGIWTPKICRKKTPNLRRYGWMSRDNSLFGQSHIQPIAIHSWNYIHTKYSELLSQLLPLRILSISLRYLDISKKFNRWFNEVHIKNVCTKFFRVQRFERQPPRRLLRYIH